jgi:hypothetical protein
MDAVTLLLHAQNAGLRVERAGDKLLVRGPRQAEPVVKLLAEHKAEVLAALAVTRSFARVVPLAEREPGLEQPSLARRGRVVVLDNGAMLHFCVKCGRFGAFGYGVRLRAGHLGRWYCGEHRPSAARGELSP